MPLCHLYIGGGFFKDTQWVARGVRARFELEKMRHWIGENINGQGTMRS